MPAATAVQPQRTSFSFEETNGHVQIQYREDVNLTPGPGYGLESRGCVRFGIAGKEPVRTAVENAGDTPNGN